MNAIGENVLSFHALIDVPQPHCAKARDYIAALMPKSRGLQHFWQRNVISPAIESAPASRKNSVFGFRLWQPGGRTRLIEFRFPNFDINKCSVNSSRAFLTHGDNAAAHISPLGYRFD